MCIIWLQYVSPTSYLRKRAPFRQRCTIPGNCSGKNPWLICRKRQKFPLRILVSAISMMKRDLFPASKTEKNYISIRGHEIRFSLFSLHDKVFSAGIVSAISAIASISSLIVACVNDACKNASTKKKTPRDASFMTIQGVVSMPR